MEIVAVSRQRIENAYPPNRSYSIISINGITEEPANLPINKKCIGTLVMHFDDIEKECGDYLVFNTTHAQQIIDFILPLQKKHGDHLCIIHCGAGISRSQAVGAALSRIFNGEDDKFFKEGIPNRVVYLTIVDQYNNQKEDKICQ